MLLTLGTGVSVLLTNKLPQYDTNIYTLLLFFDGNVKQFYYFYVSYVCNFRCCLFMYYRNSVAPFFIFV